MCCTNSTLKDAEFWYDAEYHGETVSASTNEETCASSEKFVCDPNTVIAQDEEFLRGTFAHDKNVEENFYFWTDAACTLYAKVHEDGTVALVHDPAVRTEESSTIRFVNKNITASFFAVPWVKDPITKKEIYPSSGNACGNGACSETETPHENATACLCPVSVAKSVVFDALPTRTDVLSQLFTGAFSPDMFDNGTYALIEEDGGVSVYDFKPNSIESPDEYDEFTVFKVVDEMHETVYFKNTLSTVTFGGLYAMRNPVSFFDLVRLEKRDVYYEVDAFLSSLVRHKNTAPAISRKFIQYFGVSNPSSSYVQRVTQAFIDGTFVSENVSFGDGTYGSLAAMGAAIILDPEAQSVILDEDPVNGHIREPLLKVMNVLRSIIFQRDPTVKLRYGLLHDMPRKIGQMVHEAPNQFSFFSADFSPPGFFASVGFYAPESQVLSMNSVVGIHNGLFSLAKYGLAFTAEGFGSNRATFPLGSLSYNAVGSDVASKVNDLSMLLTSGRMSAQNKQVIINAHADIEASHDIETADRIIL